VAIGIFVGLVTPITVLTAAVFSIAVVYEILRSASKPREPAQDVASKRDWKIYAIWIVVGLGYAVRASVGLVSAQVPLISPVMITSLAFFSVFGVTFVLLTWVLEASSYCWANVGSEPSGDQAWYMTDGLLDRPHIKALLSYVGVKLDASKPAPVDKLSGKPDTTDAGYCGKLAILKMSRNTKNPWNMAFVVGAGLGAATGISFAAPHKNTALLYVLAPAISIAGSLAVVNDDRAGRRAIWAALTACALSVLPIIGATHLPVALVGSIPWITIAGLYILFCASSYSDLKRFTPSAIMDKLREPTYRSLAAVLRAIVGAQTWQRLYGPTGVPPS
jgi:hypothetical protein